MEGILTQNRFFENWYLTVKRCTDLLIALPALFISIPLLLLIAFIVRLDSPGNPFFLQQRVGRNGSHFILIKFRTLFLEHFGLFTDQEAPHPYRVTRVGKYLRRYKLDEIPQFINIILGHMSVVGPRPDLPIHVENYLPHQLERLQVRPGLTGLSQVSGNTQLSWPERIVLDIWYIRNKSWRLDAKIIVHTMVTVVIGETLKTDPFKVHRLLPGRENYKG